MNGSMLPDCGQIKLAETGENLPKVVRLNRASKSLVKHEEMLIIDEDRGLFVCPQALDLLQVNGLSIVHFPEAMDSISLFKQENGADLRFQETREGIEEGLSGHIDDLWDLITEEIQREGVGTFSLADGSDGSFFRKQGRW